MPRNSSLYQKLLSFTIKILEESELKSCEGTTQRDPATMAIYVCNCYNTTTSCTIDQAEHLPGKRTRSVAYANNFTDARSITNLLH